jgi:hypothetical protein
LFILKKNYLFMKKLVLSTLVIAFFSSAALSQTPTNAPAQGTSNKKVELKANKPASVPAATTTPPPPPSSSVKVEKPQANVPKVEAPAMNPMGDLGALGKSITSELGTRLLLNQVQGTKVGQLISTFLTAKSAILPLMKSDPTGFASKLSGAQGDLMGGLKTVLSAQQMTNFMNLKPKTNDATNVLSSLFF